MQVEMLLTLMLMLQREKQPFIIQSGDPENLDIDAGYYQKCTIGDIQLA